VSLLLAGLSAICFGTALVTAKFGLRRLNARAGAAISIPTATLLFILAAPFFLDTGGFVLSAALLFALVGLFFPAIVTLLTFTANDRLGPSVTGTISSTAPLFALLAAAVALGEHIHARALFATCGVVAGVALLSWRAPASKSSLLRSALVFPIAGAIVRGLAQAMAKAGLLLWPNPFAAGLIGYVVSSTTVIVADRATGSLRRPRNRQTVAWFAATGLLNGSGVLLMYIALSRAPVSLVAPVVAAYPLVTVLLSAILLRDERLNLRVVLGTLVTVAAVTYLVAG
jgi:drug/metabolite transporter (DMT)-like permease